MKLSPTQSTPKELLLYIALAYVFGLLVRLMVLFQYYPYLNTFDDFY